MTDDDARRRNGRMGKEGRECERPVGAVRVKPAPIPLSRLVGGALAGNATSFSQPPNFSG